MPTLTSGPFSVTPGPSLPAANEEAEVYAVGLCKDCYAAFLNNSGGYKAGKNPPCFDKPARRRKRRRTDEVKCCL